MIEETIKQAAGTLSQSVWGALLILSWVIFALVYRQLNTQLKEERDSHQKTREARFEELKGQNQMAAGVLSIQQGQKELSENLSKQQGLLIDALTKGRAL